MGEAAEPTFRITSAEGGYEGAYAVALPADLVAEFAPRFRARITLGAGAGKPSHAFDATCETSGDGLRVTADASAVQAPFAVGDSTTFDIDAYAIDDPAGTSAFWSTPIAEIAGTFGFAGRSGCSGCSRDPGLKPYHGSDDTCWCFSQVDEA